MFNKCILIVVLIFTIPVFLFACSDGDMLEGVSDKDYEHIYDLEYPKFSLNRNEDFEMLIFNDLLLTGTDTDEENKTLEGIAEILDNNNPFDLVVLNGNVFNSEESQKGYNKLNALKNLANIFQSRNQSFTFVNGEKDGVLKGSSKALVLEFNKFSTFIIADTRNIEGTANYYIRLFDDKDNERHRIIFIDSGRLDDNKVLQPLHQSQIQWYNTVAQEALDVGALTSIIMYSPFNEFLAVYNDGEKNANENYDADGGNDIKGMHEISSFIENDALLTAIKQKGNNALIVAASVDSEFLRYSDDMFWFLTRSGGHVNLTEIKKGATKVSITCYATEKKDMYYFGKVDYS
ncbi:MAG: hypothetical protein LBF12_03355 [Christensenellaceae bacterium]|nr:hypothetical protein [Christensenellaceae bacterium]